MIILLDVVGMRSYIEVDSKLSIKEISDVADNTEEICKSCTSEKVQVFVPKSSKEVIEFFYNEDSDLICEALSAYSR